MSLLTETKTIPNVIKHVKIVQNDGIEHGGIKTINKLINIEK